MKKIIVNLAVSLDGFIEGPNGETDWCILDDDMDFDGFLNSIDTIFYGRISFDAWGKFEPGEEAGQSEQKFWNTIHAKKKFVFSRQKRHDSMATFIDTDIPDKVNEIKQAGGNDIWLYGGASLLRSFIKMNLVDIYQLSVHPVVLGKGKPLFDDLQERINLQLLETRTFKSGVTQLFYKPEKS